MSNNEYEHIIQTLKQLISNLLEEEGLHKNVVSGYKFSLDRIMKEYSERKEQ
jgi:hypothetical protein